MLGNLYAAQLYEAAKKDIPTLDQEFEKGNFRVLLNWLREKVHRFGLVEEAPKLIQRVTGQAPSSRPWLTYIRDKFGQIYNVSLNGD
jgi:carboxypeptidase Taq